MDIRFDSGSLHVERIEETEQEVRIYTKDSVIIYNVVDMRAAAWLKHPGLVKEGEELPLW